MEVHKQDVIRKVKKTIALAEGGANDAESETAWGTVRRLLSDHDITLEEVYSGSRSDSSALQRRLSGFVDKFPSRKARVIPWSEFFRIERDTFVTFQVIPDRSVESGRAVESILHTMHAMYENVFDRFWNEGFSLVFKTKDYCSYRIVYEQNRVTFYIVVPARHQKALRHTIESVWPKCAIQVVDDPIGGLDPKKTTCGYVDLRDHYFKATLVNRNRTVPFPSLVSAGRNVIEEDIAVFDMTFVPVSDAWKARAKTARDKYRRNKEPKKIPSRWSEIIYLIGDFLVDGVFEKLFGLLDVMFGAEPVDERNGAGDMFKRLRPATEQKSEHEGFNTIIRIASQSENSQRAKQTMRIIGTALKDVSLDNEFELRPVNNSKSFVQKLVHNRVPFALNSNILSTPECSQLLQLPTASIQDEYPEIERIDKVEVTVGQELFMDVPGITLGEVTERGITKTARIPLSEYTLGEQKIERKHVYDALTTALCVYGKQGSGKTDGIGVGHSIDMLKAGFSVFLLDTADGQVAKTLTDALPKDFPDDKVIFLDFRNVEYAIPLSFADVAESIMRKEDNELAEMQMTTRLTSHMLEFLNLQSATGELTDRMRRFFVSCAKATRGRPLWIQLALTSPSYREELLNESFVRSQPDVVQDLEALQERARSGTDGAIVDPILERMRMFERNPFLANVFLSEDKRNARGELEINFRRFADNPEGGYGYCVVIVCDKEAYGPEGQELVCSIIESKITLAAYSRIDQEQDKRKPFMSVSDEVHRYIRGGAAKRLYSDAAVELRKYRERKVILAHSPIQLGEVWEIFQSGGAQTVVYKTENLNDYKKIEQQLAPYDADYVYKHLPEKWEAVCKIRLPSGMDNPAFFCKMAPPPKPVKDRGKVRENASKRFGIHWKTARDTINEIRTRYARMDAQWEARREDEESERKQAERERKKEERKARRG